MTKEDRYFGWLICSELTPFHAPDKPEHYSFSGEFRLKLQPLALQYVEMMGNNFSPTIRVWSEPGLMRFKLTGRWIQAMIDENGNRHPNEYMILSENGKRFQREISSDEDDYIW